MIESLEYLREPLWLYLGLLPLVFLVVPILLRRLNANQYSDKPLREWAVASHRLNTKGRYRQIIFTVIAWISFSIALAGPRLPEKIINESPEHYQEVMLVMDLSLSMSARDKLPSRIERAKLEVFDLIERMQNVRLGVIVYAAKPHLLTPFTYDKQALRHYIRPIRTQLLPTEGSDTLAALSLAIKQFSQHKTKPRAIILISDGESNLTAQQNHNRLKQLSTQLKNNQVQLYTLGMGTKQGAALLSNHSGWLSINDQAVISRLDRNALQNLASIGNGRYSDVQDNDDDWQIIYDRGIALLPHKPSNQNTDDRFLWHERFSAYIMLAIISLFLALWPVVKKDRSVWIKKDHSHLKTSIFIFFLCNLFISFSGFLTNPVHANELDRQYSKAYEQLLKGDTQQAKEIFAQLPGYKARFAEAYAAYQLGQYKLAIPIFIQATLDANSEQQRINSVFNLANCYFKLEEYQQAASLYQDVLRYRASHPAAKVNLAYARNLIQIQLENEYPATARTGNGPHSVDAPDNTDVSEGKVSLGESESINDPIRERSNIRPEDISTLSGLLDSSPASAKIEHNKDNVWTYDITDLTLLQQSAPRIQTDESQIWQRLFEVEENFEAAQEQPVILPGVKPW